MDAPGRGECGLDQFGRLGVRHAVRPGVGLGLEGVASDGEEPQGLPRGASEDVEQFGDGRDVPLLASGEPIFCRTAIVPSVSSRTSNRPTFVVAGCVSASSAGEGLGAIIVPFLSWRCASPRCSRRPSG